MCESDSRKRGEVSEVAQAPIQVRMIMLWHYLTEVARPKPCVYFGIRPIR
jgi:hypothetical protein